VGEVVVYGTAVVVVVVRMRTPGVAGWVGR
jgi:hypothetical protein